MKNSGRGSSELSTSIGLHAERQQRVRSHNINPVSQTNGVHGSLLALRTFSISSLRRSLNGLSSTSACTQGSPAVFFFFFQAEDGIRDLTVTGVQTCALPISSPIRRCIARRR